MFCPEQCTESYFAGAKHLYYCRNKSDPCLFPYPVPLFCYGRLSASEAANHVWIAGSTTSTDHIADAHAAIRSKYLERKNKAKR
jgi:hypothetical protein